MALTRESLLSIRPKLTSYLVPEWDQVILLRPLSVAGLGDFLDARDTLASTELYALLMILSVCDHNGDALFTREDLEALKRMDFATVKCIGETILAINRLGQGADEALAKN